MKKGGKTVVLALLLFAKALEVQSVPAPQSHKDMVLLAAEQVISDGKMGTVTFLKGVKISSNNQSLMADKVIYNPKADKLIAIGNVVLRNAEGVYHYSNYAEMPGDFKKGIAHELKIIQTDKSRLAGRRFKYKEGRGYDIKMGSYSPCDNCKTDPDRPLVWDLRAPMIYYDNVNENVTYYHAHLSLFGIPVFYSPFIRHAGPRSQRRSGFLWPQFIFSATGIMIVPLYVLPIGVSQELLLRPIVSGDGFRVLWGRYESRFHQGHMLLDGSLAGKKEFKTKTPTLSAHKKEEEEGPLHWYIKANTQADLTEHWRGWLDGQFSSKRSYSVYPFGQQDTSVLYTNQGGAEAFYGRQYLLVKASSFLNMREGESPTSTPFILPQAEWDGAFDSELFGGTWTADFFSINMDYPYGNKDRRVFLDVGWHRSVLAPFGQILSFSLEALNHFYSFAEPEKQYYKEKVSGKYNATEKGCTTPGGSLYWRWPWIFEGRENNSCSLEPVVGTVFSAIPSPDYQLFVRKVEPGSLSYAITEYNFWRPHRLPKGNSDAPGGRLVYGGKSSLYSKGSTVATAILGQSYTLTDPELNLLRKSTTQKKKRRSYLVGSLSVYSTGMSITMRGQYDTYIKRFMHYENSFSTNLAGVGIGFSVYNTSQPQDNGTYSRTTGASLSLSSSVLSVPWSWSGSFAGTPLALSTYTFQTSTSLRIAAVSLSFLHKSTMYVQGEHTTGTVEREIDLSYYDECLTVTLQATQNFSLGKDDPFYMFPQQNTNYLLTFNFKNLGSITNAELGNMADSLNAS
ncbi:MAG: hypothetical protein LBJ70_00450 [Holosporales bacterium]|jgi:lipopolysaccharide assembly outer membrane protein LptD (OstA)|nr:hypothetical protein [Holosporales bacterium]